MADYTDSRIRTLGQTEREPLNRRRFRMGGLLIVAMVEATLAGTLPRSEAQVPGRNRRMPGVSTGVDADGPSSAEPIVELPAPIANLFVRAEEGAARRDWKLAIDSLQRIIDHPDGALVRREERTGDHQIRYESVWRRATRDLAMLPPEGLRAYRLLHDGKAKGLYERAVAAHDWRGLRTIANRYLLTRYGDDASERLASWALDAGRPVEALVLLTTLIELVPDFDVPQGLVASKLAAAYGMLGRQQEARSFLAEFCETVVSTPDGECGELWMRDLMDGIPRAWGASDVAPGTVTSWPMAGGTPSRRGRMPQVMPTLVHPLPWRFDIPGAGGNRWPQVVHEHPDDLLELPSSQLAVEGERVYLRTPRGVTALDVDDLRLLWRVPPEDDRLFPSRRRYPGSLPGGVGTAMDPFLEDVLSGISVAHNLVLTVDGGHGPSMQDESDTIWTHWIARGRSVSDVFAELARATRLKAYDPSSGELVWQRGRTTDPADVLGDAEFRSVPIAVGEMLWAPFSRQGDLFIAVLDPINGSLVHEIPLCSVVRPRLGSAPNPRCAHAYGTVYVATGYGILFAVGADDYQLRWANEDASAWQDGGALPAEHMNRRLASPLVASGGMVLLARIDRPELLAFSAMDGRRHWSTHVDDSAYIIAADDEHVWLGGRHLSRLSIDDGTVDWTSSLESKATGRAVLAGNLLLVPTLGGLLSLDADTSAVVNRQPLPGAEHPLGNLVCVRSALFSVDSSGVRKFPGLAGGYAQAVARLDADPTNVRLAQQLAWLELFREEPARALEILESVPTGMPEEEPARAEAGGRVRVEAYLALAKRVSSEPAKALEMLRKGLKSALTTKDRLRCSLALADQLDALGRHLEAWQILWELGYDLAAEKSTSLADSVEGNARIAISDRLRRIDSQLTAGEASQAQKTTLERLAALVDALNTPPSEKEAAAGLRAIADLSPSGVIRQRALFELANWSARHERYEHAEKLLAECAGSDSDHSLATAALMRICEMYRRSQHPPMQLVNRLDELARRFGTDPVPEIIKATERSDTGEAAVATVGDWVANQESCLPAVDLAAARRWNDAAAFALTGDLAWSSPVRPDTGPLRLVHFGDNAPAVVADRLVFFGSRDTVVCVTTDRAETLWATQLRLPEIFSRVWEPEDDDLNGRRCAVADGQIGVFAGRDGLFAVGLVTGRRLWAKRFEFAGNEPASGHHDMTMAAADGLLAAIPRAGRLSLMRLADGTTLWERDLRGEPVSHVWMLSGRVVTADAFQTRLHVFQREDGRLIEQVLFQQPDPDHDVVNLVHTRGIVCGPQSTAKSDSVIAVDLATGQTVWRTTVDKPLVQLFKPQEGYIGIGLLGGDVWIADAATGKIILDRRVPGARAVTDGVLFDGTLLVQHVQVVGGKRLPRLVALDVATGDLIWHRRDFAPAVGLNAALRLFDGCLPAMIEYSEEGMARRKAMGVAVIDARTGENVGADVKLIGADSRTTFSGDFRVFPGGVVIGTDEAFVALGSRPIERQDRGGN